MNYRKSLLITSLIIIVAILCIAIFIPKTIRLHQSKFIVVNSRAYFRTITDESKWHQWWPEGHFNILATKEYSTTVRIKSDSDSLLTEMTNVPFGLDSVLVIWDGLSESTSNPWSKLKNYYKVNGYKRQIKLALSRLDSFYSSEENIYAMKIIKQHVIDSTLIATSSMAVGYPGIPLVDSMIRILKQYAVRQETSITGLPMLNVLKSDSIHYLVRVALPVSNKLRDSGNIVYRAMLGGGNILVTEVHGGPSRINKTFAEMENYISDHKRTAPAIPFQSLVTDRSIIQDTGKWVTKVFYPVM